MRRLNFIRLLSAVMLLVSSFTMAKDITVASWNIEWLNSHPGKGKVKRTAADYEALNKYAEMLDADLISLQEVDGPEAARKVFGDGYNYHFSSRNAVQRVGIAIRKGIDFKPEPDYTELNVGRVRNGVSVTLNPGSDQEVRVMAVHLKSGCFSASLNSRKKACKKLSKQVAPLEQYIEYYGQNKPIVVLGDFNRRMSESDELWQEIDDGYPNDLILLTEGTSKCSGGKYPRYIDHIVINSMIEGHSFKQLVFSQQDEKKFKLSDHCPISAVISI